MFNWIFRTLGCPRWQMFRFPAVDGNGGPDWDKHKSEVPRMMLIATHAHPRAWPPKEGGVWELVCLFFWRDPIQLVEQLAPIGMHLSSKDVAVYLKIDEGMPDGMLWLFANDKWMTACDNSGAVRLRIKHVAAREAHRPLWTLKRIKDGAACEHTRLGRLNEQTADDQKKDRQPRAVWICDPKIEPKRRWTKCADN